MEESCFSQEGVMSQMDYVRQKGHVRFGWAKTLEFWYKMAMQTGLGP
jgi:hypothetical protein